MSTFPSELDACCLEEQHDLVAGGFPCDDESGNGDVRGTPAAIVVESPGEECVDG